MSKKKRSSNSKKHVKLKKRSVRTKKHIIGNKHKTHSRTQTEKISTNIKNLDRIVEGGFNKNSTNLIVGNSGSGKTIFAMQFLIGGMNDGEKCLYVTFEEKKIAFYDNMKKFGWDLEEYEKKGLLTFLEYTPSKVKTMLDEGGGTIESVILTKKITRIVIDSISSFELLFEDELSKREAAIALFGMIRDWSCTSLLTYEEEPTEKEKVSSHALEFESDSIIIMYFISDKGKRMRFIEVLKMRGTEHSTKMYPFEITNKGVSISKKPVARSFGR